MNASATLAAVRAAAGRLEWIEGEARAARGERDALIRQARREGFSLREIGEAAGLHYTAVRKAAGEAKEDPR